MERRCDRISHGCDEIGANLNPMRTIISGKPSTGSNLNGLVEGLEANAGTVAARCESINQNFTDMISIIRDFRAELKASKDRLTLAD